MLGECPSTATPSSPTCFRQLFFIQMTDVGATIQKASLAFGHFKAAFDAKRDSECEKQLAILKPLLLALPTYLDPAAESPSRAQELMLVRETLEHAVLFAARTQRLDDMEQYVAQVKVYYNDFTASPSERRLLVLGLNLLRLLTQSKTAEFHSELAAIPHSDQSARFIRVPVNIERYIMEGSYNRLLTAQDDAPAPEFTPLLALLQDTVRTEIAQCIPKAYESLTVKDAARMLMCSDEGHARDLGTAFQWRFSADGKSFLFAADDSASEDGCKRAASKVIPFKDVLTEHVRFASQLQRVV